MRNRDPYRMPAFCQRWVVEAPPSGGFMDRKNEVIRELKRRARRGRSLASGANRGDWLYAAAVLNFGSWGKAVEAAGFDYHSIRSHPLTKEEVIEKLKSLDAAGEPLAATEHGRLADAAKRHFGSWRGAVAHVGGIPAGIKWTRDTVIAGIRAREKRGEPVNSARIWEDDNNLYMAGRRRFGTWAAALAAAGKPRRG